MNDHVANLPVAGTTKPDRTDPWSNLLALARLVQFDEASGTLTIRNGKASLVLCEDGTLRIEGVRVVQTADRDIRLHAATIELN